MIVDNSALEAVLAGLAEVGRKVVIPGFTGRADLGIRAKADEYDLVTDADEAAEELLSRALEKVFPGGVVVGEEGVAADPAVLSGLAGAEIGILIDPIDGTWNFANGVPIFGMMVAITHYGRTIAGAIHYPLTGDFIYGRADKGAFYRAHDGAEAPLRAAAARAVEDMSGFVAQPLFPKHEQLDLARRSARFQRTTNFRCSAYEYRLIAQGSLHFSLNAGLKPWDHAAGVLIHQLAGGHAGLLGGQDYHPGKTEGYLLLGPDPESWQTLREVFTGQG